MLGLVNVVNGSLARAYTNTIAPLGVESEDPRFNEVDP